MPHLELGNLLGNGGPLPADLFERMGTTLEGLRHTLLGFSQLETHPFAHMPPPPEGVQLIRSQARSLRREAEVLVVAGIGGSSLGASVLCCGPRSRVVFLEGVDPETLGARLAAIPWDRAALAVVSKSGGTLETLVNAALALEALQKAAPDRWRSRVAAVASPGDGALQRWCRDEGLPVLDIPPAVGGRYSVLSAVGLLPAAFDGVDPSALVAGARAGMDRCLLLQGDQNPALGLALALVQLYAAGRTEVDLWGYGSRPYAFARWVQQLWGESLGRRLDEHHRVGPSPVACRGSEDQHSLLQLFVDGPPNRWVLLLTQDAPGPSLSAEARAFAGLPPRVFSVGTVQEALTHGTQRALHRAGVPAARYHLGAADAASLGEAFYVFMAATLYAAALLEVDPFGQPGVEAGKRFTRDYLEGAE